MHTGCKKNVHMFLLYHIKRDAAQAASQIRKSVLVPVFFPVIFIFCFVFTLIRSICVSAVLCIHCVFIGISVGSIYISYRTSAVSAFIFIILCHLGIPPVDDYRITLAILPKSRKNIHQNDIAFFSSLYYNLSCKKNLPFKNFFYITPYLIIYTPLERPGSSPTGYFSVYL